jgi:hypothetical protein
MERIAARSGRNETLTLRLMRPEKVKSETQERLDAKMPRTDSELSACCVRETLTERVRT